MKRMYNRIVMFCDYGLDDAIATVHILRRSELYSHLDIVPVGGNVDVFAAFRNAGTLLAACGADRSKTRLVDTRGIAQPAADIYDIHGSDGMGGVLDARDCHVPVIDYAAFRAELRASAEPNKYCVLSLGPCTVPNMLGYAPRRTVIMGGTVSEPPNYGDHEFNEAMDTRAFKSFAPLASGVATLDTCHDPSLDFSAFDLGDIGEKLMAEYKRLCEERNALFTVYDLVAAYAVTDPERFRTERIRRKNDGTELNVLKKI